MSTSPLVSVCIPTFNGSATIHQAILSVVNQSLTDFEIIVSDDGSTDCTVDIVRKFNDGRIRILDKVQRTTASANWNRCVEGSHGLYVKVMGQDDILYPTCLESEYTLISSTQAALCFSRRDVISQRGRVLIKNHGPHLAQGEYGISTLLPKIIRSGSNPIGEPVAAMFSREAFDRSQGFNGDYVIDVDMWIQLLERGNAVFTNKTLCAFRVGDRSWSHQLRTSQARETVQLFTRSWHLHPHSASRFVFLQGTFIAYLKQLVRVPAIALLNYVWW